MDKIRFKAIFMACALVSGTALAKENIDGDKIFEMKPLHVDNISLHINIGSRHIQSREYNNWEDNETTPFNEKKLWY